MSMKVMYDLKDMLCAELDEIGKKGEMSAGDGERLSVSLFVCYPFSEFFKQFPFLRG